MISPIESFGEFMLFRCQVCKTIFNCAAEVSKGNRLITKPDGTDPVRSNFVSIHMKCPRCLEKRVYRLWLSEK
jgi:hypothetical protein